MRILWNEVRVLLLVVFCVCCTAEPETPERAGDASDLSEPIAGEEDKSDTDERTEEDLREETALIAEQAEIERRLKAGEPLPEDEPPDDRSEYQRWVEDVKDVPMEFDPDVPAWLRLGRWIMSEGPQDREALLQMAHNRRHKGESLSMTIARRAQHVSLLKAPKAARQLASAFLPAEGSERPKTWFECKETKKVTLKSGKVRWKRLPAGCHGFWKKVGPQWEEVRDWSKRNVHRKPRAVPGVPIDQGAPWEAHRTLEPAYNHLCFLGQPNPPKGNFFYGLKSNPRNKCLPIPSGVLDRGKTISVSLLKKREAFQKARRRVQRKQRSVVR